MRAYDGFETSIEIIRAIEALTNSSMLAENSPAYALWVDGYTEQDSADAIQFKMVEWINENYPGPEKDNELIWGIEVWAKEKNGKYELI